MASLTAIELGADTCALARTSVRGGDVRLLDAVVLDPASFPGEQSYTVGMRHARRTAKLPRRARVVVWGLEEGSSAKDAALKPLLVPLANAGFRVERLVSPCDALAALARVRTPVGEGSTCWVAVNRGGVAIVVVRPGKQLYAHSFLWNSNVGATGSQARLLQRYSLVSFLSPEIKRGMQEARRQGTPISAVVTCGNLPDLRSLTMPLIEELDLEVETLDSLDGLSVSPPASDKLADIAPAIRLACAGAIARPTRSRGESKRATAHRAGAVLGAAAVVVAIAVVGYGWYRLRSPVTVSQVPLASTPSAIPSRPVKPPPPVPAGPPQGAPETVTAPVSTPVVPPAVPADKPEASPATMPALLKEPLPRILAILVANDRRFATIGEGRIVGIGDRIGRRTVVAIEENAVVLREPSGVRIRVGLSGRVLGVERGR